MVELTTKIIDPIGLHARPASITVSVATEFESNIKIISNDKTGNLKSIMNVMALGIKKGDSIKIIAKGSDEKQAIKKIKQTMKSNNLI